jgi:hypothetical protein
VVAFRSRAFLLRTIHACPLRESPLACTIFKQASALYYSEKA